MFFVWGSLSLIAYVVPVWLIALSSDERARLRHTVGAAGFVKQLA
jgi:hypothetical protein